MKHLLGIFLLTFPLINYADCPTQYREFTYDEKVNFLAESDFPENEIWFMKSNVRDSDDERTTTSASVDIYINPIKSSSSVCRTSDFGMIKPTEYGIKEGVFDEDALYGKLYDGAKIKWLIDRSRFNKYRSLGRDMVTIVDAEMHCSNTEISEYFIAGPLTDNQVVTIYSKFNEIIDRANEYSKTNSLGYLIDGNYLKIYTLDFKKVNTISRYVNSYAYELNLIDKQDSCSNIISITFDLIDGEIILIKVELRLT